MRTTELLTTHRADGDSAVTMSPLPIGVLTAPGADCSPGRGGGRVQRRRSRAGSSASLTAKQGGVERVSLRVDLPLGPGVTSNARSDMGSILSSGQGEAAAAPVVEPAASLTR